MLKDWALNYVKSRDAHFSNIESIKDETNSFVVTHKNTSVGSGFKKQSVPKVQTYVVCEDLSALDVNSKDTVAFTSNTNKNFDVLIKNFDAMAKNDSLKLFFVNVDSNENWQLMPFRHNRMLSITGGELKPSLKSLFDSITQA